MPVSLFIVMYFLLFDGGIRRKICSGICGMHVEVLAWLAAMWHVECSGTVT